MQMATSHYHHYSFELVLKKSMKKIRPMSPKKGSHPRYITNNKF